MASIFKLTKFSIIRLLMLVVIITKTQPSAFAQQHTQNSGDSRMHPNSQMAFYGDLTNSGMFTNNKGTASFYGKQLQNIFGTRAIDFQNLTLANANGLMLHIPVAVTSNLTFQNGSVLTPRSTPSVSLIFDNNAGYTNAADARHIDGYSSKVGRDSFSFPIGDNRLLRTASVGQTPNAAAVYRAAYFKGNPATATLPVGAPFPIGNKELTVLRVSDIEYWDIKGTTPTRLTLTWNVESRIDVLTDNDLPKVGVVGWNGSQWVNLGNDGSAGTLAAGRVRSRIVTPDSFTVFALAYITENQRCVSNAPALAFGKSTITICPNYPAVIDAKVNGYQFHNYLWSDGSSASTLTASQAGKYWVRVWDSCGNVQTDTFLVKLLPNVKLKVDPVFCYGMTNGRINILSDTSRMKVWLNNQPTFANGMTNLAAGSYRVKVESPFFCGFDSTVIVTQPTQSAVTITSNTADPKRGQEITLTVRPENGFKPVFYQWSPPTQMSCPTCQVTNTTLQDKDLHTYAVTAIDSNGCQVSSQIDIYTANPPKYTIYVPNIFKPDNEDYAVLGNPNHVKVRYMRIFDRWGELIFEAKDFKPDGSVHWDGGFRGKPLNTGTFVVTVEAEFIDGTVQRIARDVLLVR